MKQTKLPFRKKRRTSARARKARKVLKLLKQAEAAQFSLKEFKQLASLSHMEWQLCQMFYRRHGIEYPILQGMHEYAPHAMPKHHSRKRGPSKRKAEISFCFDVQVL
jgi:hypothetical protein